MSGDVRERILDSIAGHRTVIISRHTRPDGDAVGSTLGLAAALRLSFPDKRIMLDNADRAEYLAFLGDETSSPSDGDYSGALVIVLDTATEARISGDRFRRGDMLVKIDHHPNLEPYGDINWVEDGRSSTCEMIADLCLSFPGVLKLDRRAASCLYTGMVTDSGRFRYREVSPGTLRTAAALLEFGVDTERLFAELYSESFQVLRFRAELTRRIRLTPAGVAWIKITSAFREKRGISLEEASNTVGIMDAIRGSLIWLVFVENGDGSIRVRLRSRFVEVERLAAAYGGGGHACACGATVHSVGEQKALLADADALLAGFKKEHPELF
jgi:phosphoesterase RecJ-like protein